MMNGEGAPLDLASFSVSRRTGFMPERGAVLRLPDYYERWEVLIDRLQELIKTRVIRDKVLALPQLVVDEERLSTDAQWWRAYLVVTFLAQAYLWSEGEKGLPSKLPSNLAVPWWAIVSHLDMPPVITYACSALHNWSLKDPGAGITASNLYSTVTFTGTRDEEWFYLVPLLVEIAAAPGLQAMVDAFQAVRLKDNATLLHCMEQIDTAIVNMKAEFNRISDECAPSVFYNEFRPFQAGSKGLDSLPNGLIYEGVDSKPKMYSGASAAQSSTVPAFDVFLGIEHFGTDLEFLKLQRSHMPRPHREFLQELARQPSVRAYIRQCGDCNLVRCYNKALTHLSDFRTNHVVVVTRYIVLQKGTNLNASLEAKGTGGTDFMQFLKQVRDDVKELTLPEK